MNKKTLLLYIIIITIKYSQNRFLEEETESDNSEDKKEKKGIFCKMDDGFLCNHPLLFLLILLILIIAIIVFSCLFIKYCYDRCPVFRGWERTVAERLARNRLKRKQEIEELENKKKFYLLNNEIQGFKYNKQLSDFGEKCPICLETYDIYKDVCFTPCRHLFHHSCLKEYVYGIIDVKCPICKYNLYESIEKKNINFKKIKITHEIKIYNQNRIFGSENQNSNNNVIANDN